MCLSIVRKKYAFQIFCISNTAQIQFWSLFFAIKYYFGTLRCDNKYRIKIRKRRTRGKLDGYISVDLLVGSFYFLNVILTEGCLKRLCVFKENLKIKHAFYTSFSSCSSHVRQMTYIFKAATLLI